MEKKLSLKAKTTKGLLWNVVDKFAVQGTGFLISLLLARILMPSDYGLIGMLAIFMVVSQVLVESGFSSALIQKHNPTEEDYSTIFYFNLCVSIFFYLVLFFTAPLIASFYKTPQLTMITRVISLSIVINALSLVPQTKLTIRLDFKTQAKVSLFSVFISGGIGVYAAYNGFGVWALIIQILAAAFIKTVMLFYYDKWIPDFAFNMASFKQLFRFSYKLMTASLVGTIMTNIYSILIGKFFYAKELGFYTNAKQYPELLSTSITSVLLGVTYPVLSSLKDDRETMLLVYGRLMRVTVFFVMPILTLFALLSDPFIHLILTDKWMPIVPLMQWICFARLITPISALNMNILNAIGRSDLFLKVDLSKVPIVLIALVVTVPFGLKAVVIGHFVTSFIAFFINAYYPGKLFGFGVFKQLREMKTVALATILMSAGVLVSTYFISNDLLKLIVGGLSGICIYLLAAYMLKIEEVKDLKEIVQNILGKKESH